MVVQFTNYDLYAGSILFSKGIQSISQFTGTLYGYNENGSSTNIKAGSFGVSSYSIKINPNTNFAYNLISRIYCFSYIFGQFF